MNIINKLTLRQLKMNKKRTMVTIIGTIISAAMITAVATLALSFMSIMQRQSIAQNGEWHVEYYDVDEKQLDAIKADDAIKTVIPYKELGYAKLTGSQNLIKPYLYVEEFGQAGFDKFPIKLVKGRLPNKSDEIVITEEVLSNAKVALSIGDKLELTIGQRFATKDDNESSSDVPMTQTYSLQRDSDGITEKLTQELKRSYTIVGIIKRPSSEYNWSPGYTAISCLDNSAVKTDQTINAYVLFKKINTELFNTAKKLASGQGIEKLSFNNDLLRYYGIYADDSVRNMLYGLSAIIIIIIVIGSVSLIYNSFAISVSERSRYLGMLSSIGATKKQKRNSVFFEGAVIGAISIPIGILAGYVGLGITYICINPMIEGMLNVSEGFRLKVYPSALITSVVVSAATILLSTFLPAKKASNISAIDAIRQVSDVKIKGHQVRTLSITRRIFGMEGDLGLKNLKRNRGRYKATVFSLVISMLLFLVVSSFTGYLKKSLVMTQDDINFDIQVLINSEDTNLTDMLLKKMKACNNITTMSQLKSLTVYTSLDKSNAADYLVKDENTEVVGGKYSYEVVLDVLDDNSLKEYAKEIGADYKQLTDTSQISAIVIDTVVFKDKKAGDDNSKYVQTKIVKTAVGEPMNLLLSKGAVDASKQLPSIRVAALTGKQPMGVMALGKGAAFHMIMSQAAFDKMMEGKDYTAGTEVYFNSEKPLKLQEELEQIQADTGVSDLYIFNVYDLRKNNQQALLVVNVFTYAFIILITTICIANIMNTISTSIALRKREFAMLKSIGITPKGFNKMLNYESIFYGIKALVYGLPVSIGVIYLMYKVLMAKFDYAFTLPVNSILIAILAVFLIVGSAMLYSSRKVRKENIIDALKQEII